MANPIPLYHIPDENTGKSGHPSFFSSFSSAKQADPIVIMHTRPNRKIRLVFLPLKDDLSKEPTKEFFFAKHEGGNAKILVLLAYYLHHFRSVLNTVPKTKTTLNYEINVWGCIVCNFVWLYDSIGFLIKDKEKRQIL